MKRTRLIALLVLLVSAFGFVAQAAAQPPAIVAYLSVRGAKTGQFKGETLQKGAEALIPVFGVSYEIVSPRDVASGLATGKRQYKPIVILKELGASSPLFFNAAATNENLTEVKIEFYHAEATGRAVLFYTITLTNASIAGVRSHTGHGDAASGANGHEYEEVSFAFQKITIQNLEAKTSAMDDWTAAR